MAPWTRRRFLSVLGRGVVAAGLAERSAVAANAASARAFARVPPLPQPRSRAELGDLAALVKWIREAPADGIVRDAIDRLRAGLPPEQLWAATFLAGIEDVEPRPVGFRFHAVLVMPPLWQVASRLPPDERTLPLFFGLANFKQAQAGDARANDWSLPPPPQESSLPPAEKARAMLADAIDAWDPQAADAAVTRMARSATRDEIVQALLPCGLRNFAAVGHHPIFMSCAFKTLDAIGWSHAEPVLRCLVYGLLSTGPGDEAKPFERSTATAKKLLADHAASGADRTITRAALSPSSDVAIATAARQIGGEVGGDAGLDRAWSDLQSVGLELMMETPGLLAVHATTGSLALRELSAQATAPELRIAGALQSAAWMPMWRKAFKGGGDARESTFEQFASDAGPASAKDAAPARDLLAALDGGDRREAALKIARALRAGADTVGPFLDGARRLLVAKASESHHYKFFAALEDVAAGSPDAALRVAAGSFYLHTPKDVDFAPVAEARAALPRKA